MPKPRRIAQRKRAKHKQQEIPDYLRKVSNKKLHKGLDIKNSFGHFDPTPYNCSLYARGLADDQGGGMVI